jgi:hypothetical protein
MRNSMKAAAPGIGGVFAAAGSALCCAGPVLAVTVGVSGAGLSGFESLRPYFLTFTAASLVLGFWLLDRDEKAACVPGKPCADRAGEAVRGPRRETQDEDHAMDSHDRRGRVRNVPQLAGALLVRTEGR